MESEEAVDSIEEGDRISIDFTTGEIVNNTDRKRYFAKPIPDFMREIIQAGGLVGYIKRENDKGGIHH
ncbi:MAG: hypothetical protein JRJ02_12475 [Deltaproteobacteria bacterium]|nr:hypothetical protein [Deltaproteobacteria bacterium]